MIPLKTMIFGSEARKFYSKIGTVLLFSVILSFSAQQAMAENRFPTNLSPESISSFADHLYNEKDLYRAITEYKRLIFHFPSSPLSKKAKMKIPLTYKEGRKFDAAITALENFIEEYDSDIIMKSQAVLHMAEIYLEMKVYDDAIRLFSQVEVANTLPEIKREASLKKGWALVKKGSWSAASQIFKKLEDPETTEPTIPLAVELSTIKLTEKSPALAGTLSAILPGAGQFYVGRKKDAAVAFLLNTTFIAATIDAFDDDKNTLGAILLFFEAGWYAGNIYSSIGGAHKYNDKAKDDFIYRLERKYSITLNENGTIFGLYNLRF